MLRVIDIFDADDKGEVDFKGWLNYLVSSLIHIFDCNDKWSPNVRIFSFNSFSTYSIGEVNFHIFDGNEVVELERLKHSI